MMKNFDNCCYEILTHFQHGIIFECSKPFRKSHAVGELVSEARITETDEHLLEDILERLKKTDRWSYKIYEYKDILELSSPETWRQYDYFKKNCDTGFKLFVFMSDYKYIEMLKKEFPDLADFFDRVGEKAFGIAWPFNYRETYIWLNREAILADPEPKERIHHEMIHAWGAIMNVDEHKSFARHDPEDLIEQPDENQKKFLELNKILSRKQPYIDAVNYCIGQNGLEFESQVNDICDAFGYFYRKFLSEKEYAEVWINKVIEYVNRDILDTPVLVLINKLNLAEIYSEDFPGYYQSRIELYFMLHGLLKSEDKLWYLDEALLTHFTEDLQSV